MQRYFGIAQTLEGQAVPSATVRVRLAGTATDATIYSDNTYTPLANPFTSEADGVYQFYARNGRYDVIVTKTNYTFDNDDTADILLDDRQSVVSPAQITSNQNDYAPTNALNTTIWRIASDAVRLITGISAGFAQQVVRLVNVGSFNIVLVNQSSSSAVGNRFTTALGRDYVLWPNEGVDIFYDSTSTVWRVVSYQSSRLINVAGAGSVVSGTTSATSAYSFSVPGYVMATDRRLRVTVALRVTNTTGADDTFVCNVTYGGSGTTAVFSPTFSNGVTNGLVMLYMDILGTGASAQEIGLHSGMVFTGTTSPSGTLRRASITVDSTATQTLDVTAQMGAASANYSFARTWATLEWLP